MNVAKNGNGYTVNLTLKDNGIPINLTGATVTAVFVNPNSVRSSKTAVLTAPAEGKCRTTIDTQETAVVGILDMQINLSMGGNTYPSEIEHITVTDSL